MERIEFEYLPAYEGLFHNCSQTAVQEGTARKFVFMQGGSGSGKTIQALTMALAHMANNKKFECIVLRKTLAECRKTVFKDAQNAAEFAGHGHLFDWSGGESGTMVGKCNTTGSVMYFGGVDDPEKLKGLSASVQLIIADELTSFDLEDLKQMDIRIRCPYENALNMIVCTFNPIDKTNWVYKEVVKKGRFLTENGIHTVTTFRDNPLLSESNRLTLLAMIEEDPQWAECYAFGRWINKYEHQIYRTFQTVPWSRKGRAVYGLDFGHVHPTALVQVNIRPKRGRIKRGDLYARQLVYQTELDIDDLIRMMIYDLKIPLNATIICDSARPDLIKKIQKYYGNARPAHKGPGSVFSGIMTVKSFNLHLDEESEDLISEAEGYRWKKKAGRQGGVTDEPVKKHDDAMDALRYATVYLTKAMRLPAIGIKANGQPQAPQQNRQAQPAGSTAGQQATEAIDSDIEKLLASKR